MDYFFGFLQLWLSKLQFRTLQIILHVGYELIRYIKAKLSKLRRNHWQKADIPQSSQWIKTIQNNAFARQKVTLKKWEISTGVKSKFGLRRNPSRQSHFHGGVIVLLHNLLFKAEDQSTTTADELTVLVRNVAWLTPTAVALSSNSTVRWNTTIIIRCLVYLIIGLWYKYCTRTALIYFRKNWKFLISTFRQCRDCRHSVSLASDCQFVTYGVTLINYDVGPRVALVGPGPRWEAWAIQRRA